MGRKAKKVISIFLTVVLLFITVPSIEQSNMKTVKAASYNTIAAVNYAMTWGGSKRNPAYKTYDSDCANFVSQCLKAGGLDIYTAWVPTLKDTLANMGFTIIQNPSADQVEPGDVMFYDTTYTGEANHTTIITSKVNGVPKITGHTTNVLDGNYTDKSGTCSWKYGNITWAAILHTSSVSYSNIPKNCTISVDKTSINVGDTVTFTYNIDDAAIRDVGIDRDGSRYASVEVNNSRGTVSYKFNEAGTYCCIIEGRNNVGFNCSTGVYVTVTDSYTPAKPSIKKINIEGKNGYVNFTWDNVKNATCYNLFLYATNNLSEPVQSHWAIRKNTLRIVIPNGTYVVKLCSENETSNGNYYTDGDLSTQFTVNNDPQKPSITSIKTNKSNGNTTFNWNSFRNCTCYNLFIYNINDLEKPVQSHWAIRKNEITIPLDNGTYVAKLCSENETSLGNYYTDGDISDRFVVSIEQHRHEYTKKIIKQPTCKETGIALYTCSCGDTYKEVISKVSHKFTEKSTQSEYLKQSATCTKPAVYYYKCETCSAKGTETYLNGTMLGHLWNTEYSIDKKATCTETGIKSIHCKRCGAKKNSEIVNKIGHMYKKTVSKATKEKNGKIVEECVYCGKNKIKSVIYHPEMITLSKETFTYNGSVQKPKVTIGGANGQIINKSNYIVKYSSGCKKVGTYKVTILFIGNYSGKMKTEFKILPPKTNIRKVSRTLNGIKLTWNKKPCSGYKIYRKTGNSSYKLVKIITRPSVCSYTDRSIKKDRTKYTYRIKTYKSVGKKVIESKTSESKGISWSK